MKRFNKTSKYLVLSCAFLLLVNVTLGLALSKQSREAIRTQIEDRMLDVSNTAAAMLDGDVLETLQAEDVNTAEYQTILKTLSYFENNIELEYIYCLRDMGNRTFVFTIDPDPEAPGAFGEHVPYTDALYRASLGTPAVDQEPYEDEWGRFYSAYSPVFCSDGHVAGIVAVDFSAHWYEEQIVHQVNITLAISGISLLFAGAIVTSVVTRYRKRFRRLFHEMNLVSDGIETLVNEVSQGAATVTAPAEDAVPTDDEIDALGERIHSLQERLSQQIAFVRSQAYIDGLTGLANRTAYDDRATELNDGIKNGTAAFAVAMFDLNGLKEINDREGHEAGDQAIRTAADMLTRAFPRCKVYRIGGDEFVVIADSAADMSDKLNGLRGGRSDVSLSAGWAEYRPGVDMDYRMVFNRADTAMYNDKRAFYQARRGGRCTDGDE